MWQSSAGLGVPGEPAGLLAALGSMLLCGEGAVSYSLPLPQGWFQPLSEEGWVLPAKGKAPCLSP